MSEIFKRTQMLLGEDALKKLEKSRVAVFGIGGVGGHAAEALVRCGIGKIDIIDNDTVAESNLNRQIIALHSTIGKSKVEVAAERFIDINPRIKISARKCFYLPEKNEEFDRLNEQLSKCINELSEYQDYIARVYKFTDDGDLVLDSDLGLEKFSREEFIAYMFLSTNYGNYKFPSRYKEYIPENFHEIIEIYQTNTWNSFIELIEEN